MYKNAFTCLLFLYSFNLLSEISIDPGEIFSIKVVNCPDIRTRKELFINFEGVEYAILPAPFTKEELILNDYCLPVKVRKKQFGESRITIKNTSMVDLSKSDSDRAFKESKLIKQSLNTYTKDLKPSLKFISPVKGIISSRYGKQRYINEKPRSPHLALDIAAAEGASIVAPSAGRVILVGDFFYSGNYLIVDHGSGLLSSYSHMSLVHVNEGEFVNQGDVIGEIGSTGRVTGPHLHWSVYLSKSRINPESLIQENYLETLFNRF
jgi:murein DD-endopeptidase MepM/ murein hydrolase activator NlpD